MEVKFNLYALPNTEYGYLMGRITKISKDLKADEKNAGGYYLVEAAIRINLMMKLQEDEEDG